MAVFSSKSRSHNPLLSAVRRRPFAFFGLPFLSLVVISSFALKTFTSTRYELNDQKVSAVSKEDELGMNKDRKKVDLREEYYRLQGLGDDADLSGSTTPSQLAATDAAPTKTEAALAERKKKKKKNFFDTTSQDDYEPVRVPRPAGMPEWGAMPSGEDAPVKGARPEDRWV
ncbi:hypothetical protein CcaverHIS002_0107850 [Cutaneotrichosporon cavernicola]|uniref:Cytochrome c oxidase assembly protein COX16, mitochondrial n=1 Tax=Cutaneotrichosporon cavernicola TaxID=279322 RepID=A0AA48I292_9TREE|nr:uncharacterized protein CcaverHIS019_0107800 [Cutaneotrichosporon cavernicola]BEI80256.1 hypothetical protein CcaverHIS002_0107850 [Cutaneotrichosporon cavernicola]BEI88062.1 hypothetical protein CcaverHIS019_0107800 [Cutaneotrichosporon cavernicola]BEI95833.1 hypothetical protein CcaverHIS631_0107820 [Cutaneotrichosporon cavernicola]BEJ03607.1 hypothetical protein CcaverHIS641_0107820 [Cutaneotrichosporon cavernicola]